MDTSSHSLTEGALVKGGLHRVHDSSLQSPDATAIPLQTHINVYSVLDLPSLRVRGSLSSPLSPKTFSNPIPTWHAWTTAGWTITLVWTSDSSSQGVQVTCSDAVTCQALRRTSIALCPGMSYGNNLHTTCALVPNSQRLAVSLFDEHGPLGRLRVALLTCQ